MNERFAVIGLGYVGLPVAVGFARAFGNVVGFDVNEQRIEHLRNGVDATREFEGQDLAGLDLRYTTDPGDMADCTFFIVTVPTPIDQNRQPDLTAVKRACQTVGVALKKGDIVVFESTVFPGATEDICGPILAQVSGLRQGVDFALGYSPERINPGDRRHRLETITKVVSASDADSLDRVGRAYGAVVTAGLHVAPSIKVAEAAKVIENTQRDLNIALMNELALIFDRLGIRTCDVLAAAGTKWNFLPFSPGLVGGHCIGVDPYYLTAKAESVGYHPEVILAGRRINDSIGIFVARKVVKMLIAAEVPVRRARVGILGLTFKEDVPDLRNSRVPDIVCELREFGIEAYIHDPMVDAEEAHAEYGLKLSDLEDFRDLDAVVVAVAHRPYREIKGAAWSNLLRPGGVLVDIKSVVDPQDLPQALRYWSL